MKSIALLRGINVSGRNRIPMAELRTVCSSLGWHDVQTYIQSGNVVFTATTDRTTAESDLSAAIAGHFGLTIPVIVRSAAEWHAYIVANPLTAEAAADPARVMLALSKATPHEDAAAEVQQRAAAGEQVRGSGDAIWIYFPSSAADSKLTPAVLDRLAGSPVTMRNWRTVLALADLTKK